MNRILLMAVLMTAASLPAFAFDSSASAWEYRRKNCAYIGNLAVAARGAAIEQKPEPFLPAEMANTDMLYTLGSIVIQQSYRSTDSQDDLFRWAFAKCIDNIDRIYQEWQQGVKTDPQYFR